MSTQATVPVSQRDVRAVARVTVVFADDPLVHRGVCTLLDEAGFELVAEAADAVEARRKVSAHKPDVLLLDLSMPGGSSLEAIPDLLESSPRTAIVILTMHDEAALAREALRVRARRFVLKELADSELVDAIVAVSSDGYLNTRLGARIAAAQRPALSRRMGSSTVRWR